MLDYCFILFTNRIQTLTKRKYLCVDDYDEKYYDFHCLPDGKPPSEGSYWYTVCGTDFEYIPINSNRQTSINLYIPYRIHFLAEIAPNSLL